MALAELIIRNMNPVDIIHSTAIVLIYYPHHLFLLDVDHVNTFLKYALECPPA